MGVSAAIRFARGAIGNLAIGVPFRFGEFSAQESGV